MIPSLEAEAAGVKQGSQKQYLREWNKLLRRVKLTADQARAHNGNELDSIIVKHLEKLIFKGEQPTRGMKILGAMSHFLPRYCRQGDRGLPRSWRAPKGWRKLCPGRSTMPEPPGTWCAMSNALTRDGQAFSDAECEHLSATDCKGSTLGIHMPRRWKNGRCWWIRSVLANEESTIFR